MKQCTITAPTKGSVFVRCDVNADAPPEPRRDALGRFRKRTGIRTVASAVERISPPMMVVDMTPAGDPK